jgi:hypothetical protein
MANNTIQLKRSSVAGKQPNTSTLAVGELALNLTDQKLYSSNGTGIFEPASNVSSLYVGNSSVYTTVNSTAFSGTSNNATNAFGKTESNLNVNNALTSNNSSYLGGTLAAAYVQNTDSRTLSGNLVFSGANNTVTGNLTISTTGDLIFGANAGIYANGSLGTANQVLTSDGTGVYWSTVAAGSTGGTISQQQYTGDGVTTTFTVTGGYTSNNLSVYLNGVLLRNGTEANVSDGSTFTITPAPSNGALIDAIGFAGVVSNIVNVASQYVWTNTQTFSNTITFSSTINGTANNSLYLGGNTASDLRTYADNKAGNAYSNAIAYSGNAAAAYTNAVSYVDGKSYVNTNQLSTNLSNYAALSGATFTGAVVVSNNLTVTGNLTLSGNTLIVGANNLVVSDSVISLHTPANLAPLTSNDGKNIGIAFHYYDTEDRHALLYRDNSTGYLQYHTDGGDPISNSNPTGNSFGVIQAASFWAGNSSVYSTANATTYTGTANNSTNLGGVAAASYTNTSGAYTISGVHTHTANIVLNNNLNLNFQTVNTSVYVGMRQQIDDNFVFFSSNTTGGQRAVWSVFANSITSTFSVSIPTLLNNSARINSLGVGTDASGTSGEIRATNEITAYYSDERLKTDIKVISDALNKVSKITGVTYIENEKSKELGFNSDARKVGVLAQQIQKVLPEAIRPAPFDIAEDGTSISGENYLTVKYENLIPLLIEAINELAKKVEKIEGK